jgi:DNA polymerase III epsilon subunit-like protein
LRIVFFDLETGGLDDRHPTIQIAAIATESFVEVGTFEAKIAFDPASADPAALAVNHYDARVWSEESRPEAEVVAAFAGFLSKHATLPRVSRRNGAAYTVACLAGHNVLNFDMPRLQRMFERHGRFLPADRLRPLDTLQLALWHSHTRGRPLESYTLSALCGRFGIDSARAHDALADVRMTARLARVLYGAEAA